MVSNACPKCKNNLVFADLLVGKEIACNKCGTRFVGHEDYSNGIFAPLVSIAQNKVNVDNPDERPARPTLVGVISLLLFIIAAAGFFGALAGFTRNPFLSCIVGIIAFLQGYLALSLLRGLIWAWVVVQILIVCRIVTQIIYIINSKENPLYDEAIIGILVITVALFYTRNVRKFFFW